VLNLRAPQRFRFRFAFRPHQADAATKITNSRKKKPPGHALFEGPTVSLASAAAVSGARSPPQPAKRSTGVQTLGERR
jgi:hypothetical protein